MIIREAEKSDLNDVLNAVNQAFGSGEKGKETSDLVKNLLNDPSASPLLSLIAIKNKHTIGHILFTKAAISNFENSVSAVLLAPLAVIPAEQSKGIGGELIQKGLEQLSHSGVELVFVLGHPDYYPRHGFSPAGALGFEAPYHIPEEHAGAWMVQELQPGAIEKANGKIICANALNRPEYWRE